MNCTNTIDAAQHQAGGGRPRARGGEQALHQELVGAVRGQRERDAAEHSGPQRVDRRRIGAEIDDGELAGRRPGAHHFVPAAGDAAEQRHRHRTPRRRRRRTSARRRSRSPPPRRRAPCRGSSPRRPRAWPTRVGTPVTTLMTIEVAKSRMPSASERVTRKRPAESVVTRRPKRRCSNSYEVIEIAAEVGRDEERAHDHPADDVAERQLQERHVAGIGRGGNADERERARLGGDDRAAHRPPRHGMAAQEVVAGGVLEASEPRPERGDGGEVGGDDGIVERSEHAGQYKLRRCTCWESMPGAARPWRGWPTPTGQVVGEGRAGGANLHSAGELATEKTLFEVIHEALGDRTALPEVVCVGMAGMDRPADEAVVRAILRRLGFRGARARRERRAHRARGRRR